MVFFRVTGRMPGDHHGGGMRGSGNGMNDYGGKCFEHDVIPHHH